MKILQKNGKERIVRFDPDVSSALLGDYSGIRLSGNVKSDRWVNAINQAMVKKNNVEKNPLELLQIRYAKGEISREEYEEMREVIEKK